MNRRTQSPSFKVFIFAIAITIAGGQAHGLAPKVAKDVSDREVTFTGQSFEGNQLTAAPFLIPECYKSDFLESYQELLGNEVDLFELTNLHLQAKSYFHKAFEKFAVNADKKLFPALANHFASEPEREKALENITNDKKLRPSKRRSIFYPKIRIIQKLELEIKDLKKNQELQIIKRDDKEQPIGQPIFIRGSREDRRLSYTLNQFGLTGLPPENKINSLTFRWSRKKDQLFDSSPKIKAQFKYIARMEGMQQGKPSATKSRRRRRLAETYLALEQSPESATVRVRSLMGEKVESLNFYNKKALRFRDYKDSEDVSSEFLCKKNSRPVTNAQICFLPYNRSSLKGPNHYIDQFGTLKTVFEEYGFKYKVIPTTLGDKGKAQDLAQSLKGCNQLWVTFFYQKMSPGTIQVINNFMQDGHGVMVWADNFDFNSIKAEYGTLHTDMPANDLMQAFTGHYELTADYGDRAEQTNLILENGLDNGVVSRPALFGIQKMYEGHSVSRLHHSHYSRMGTDGFTPLLSLHQAPSKVVTFSHENQCQTRWAFDGGWTRLFKVGDSRYPGNKKFLINMACWLTHFEKNYDELTR